MKAADLECSCVSLISYVLITFDLLACAIEIIVACSAMAILKQEEAKQEEQEPKSKWAKWKCGGIIGTAAITGGTLIAITGGLAAPAIAAGFSALAPTLGTIIPVIGAGVFAAVATAAGSVAGSVTVAASFGGKTVVKRWIGFFKDVFTTRVNMTLKKTFRSWTKN